MRGVIQPTIVASKGFVPFGVIFGLVSVIGLIPGGTAEACSFTVNNLGDAGDAAINGVCATAGGVCTLRAAIQETEGASCVGADTIGASVSGTIVLGSILPTLTDGGTTIDGGTLGGSVLTLSRNGNVFNIDSDDNVLRDLVIQGDTNRNDTAIDLTTNGAERNFIERVRVNDFGVAVHIAGDASDGNAVCDSEFINQGGHGVLIENSDNTLVGEGTTGPLSCGDGAGQDLGNLFDDTTGSNVMDHAIEVTGSATGTQIRGNTIDSMHTDAILASGTSPQPTSTQLTIQFNVITDDAGSTQEGIETDQNFTRILGNSVTSVGDNCILINGADFVWIDENLLTDCGDNGIKLDGSLGAVGFTMRGVISDNEIQNAGTDPANNEDNGILLTGSDIICVQGNLVNGSAGNGLITNGSQGRIGIGFVRSVLTPFCQGAEADNPPSGVPAPGNVFSNNGGFGVVIGGGGNAQGARMSRNSFFGNTSGGIDNNDDGLNANDGAAPLDSTDDNDGNANRRLDFPTVTQAAVAGPGDAPCSAGDLWVEYAVYSPPNSGAVVRSCGAAVTCSNGQCAEYSIAPANSGALEIEAYIADTAGVEGETYLGTFTYPIAEAGCVVQQCLAPATAVSEGDDLVFLTIDDSGRTSEFSGTVTTTPVTLGSFQATRRGDVVRFEWTTAAEMANLGFNLYTKSAGRRQKINADGLIPSRVIDSSAPQLYVYEASVEEDQFWLEDVDILGRTRRHGPFGLDRMYGARSQPRRIDWASVRAEHEAKQAARTEVLTRRWSLAESGSGEGTYPVYELLVSDDGLHRVTYEQLLAEGLDLVGAPVEDLALTRRGEPVKIRVHGPGATFGAGGFIDFLAEASETLYTDTEVYRLEVDSTKALRMLAVGGQPSGSSPSWYAETVEVNRDLIYDRASPTGEPWIDSRLVSVGGSPAAKDFTFEVDHLVEGIHPGLLEVDFYGGSWFDFSGGPDHHAVLELNGVEIADQTFNGLARFDTRIRLPAGALQEGTNTFRLTAISDLGYPADVIALNTYGATYARAPVARNDRLEFRAKGRSMRVSGFTSNQIVAYASLGSSVAWLMNVNAAAEGASYEAHFRGHPNKQVKFSVSAVDAIPTPGIRPARPYTDITSGPADYLIITHADFENDLGALVSARQAQGLTVETVVVDDIYAQFSWGNFDAEAIRTYLGTIADTWGLEYVLFVGGDTTDYLGQVSSSISFIPTIYVPTHPVVQYTPSDPAMTDWDGNGVPNLAHGRLPVRTSGELGTVIQKILDYPTAGHAGSLVFAADNSEMGTSFAGISEALAAQATGVWTVERAYLPDAEAASVTSTNATLVAAINGGAALVSYLGHSSFTVWTFDGLFNTTDASGLTNFGQPTVVTQWGCWNTYHVDPDYDTMSHILMLDGANGAAASLGASTLTSVASDQALGPVVLQKLVGEGKTLGQAIQEAKEQVGGDPSLADVLYGWTLLGDPAMSLAAPGGS